MKIKDILNEALNPQLGQILALANQYAVAIANMKIYDDDIFANHLKIGGLGTMVDWYKQNYTAENYADAKRQAISAKNGLDRLGVEVNYNESFPVDFSLSIPGHDKPYTFNIIDMLKSTMATFQSKSKAVKEVAPVAKAWNPDAGEIYEAANDAARALYCLGVLTNPAFARSEGGYAQQLSQILGDPEDYEEAAEMALSTLSEYGARLTYNRNSPRVFTLTIPKMPAHTFDIREVVDSAQEMSS